MKALSLKKRIWLLPAVTFAVLCIGMALVALLTASTLATIERLRATDYPYLQGLTRFASMLDATATAAKGAVAAGEQSELAPVRERVTAMEALLKQLHPLQGKQVEVEALQSRLGSYASHTLTTAEIMLGVTKGDASTAIPKMQAAHAEMERAVTGALKAAGGATDSAISSAAKDVTSVLSAVATATVLVVLAMWVGSRLLVRSIWQQIGGEPAHARAALERVAGGDLTANLGAGSPLPGSLMAALGHMIGSLSDIVATVRQGSMTVTHASDEIAAGNLDLSQRTERAAANLQSTAHSLETLTGTVSHTANSAQRAAQLAERSASVAGTGVTVVGEVVQTMRAIKESSRRITEITSVIDGIAFQTNILALNAAVEAAHAGEQGRGFGVVAAEVRTLARRCAESAKEIKSLIVGSAERVEAGTALVEQAGRTIQDIAASAHHVTAIVAEIRDAAVAQSGGIEHVNNAVAQLDQMVQQNAALVEQSAAASESMRHQSQALTESVAVFRLQPTVE